MCVCVCAHARFWNDVSAPVIYHILVGREEEDRDLQSLELQGQVKGHRRSGC